MRTREDIYRLAEAAWQSRVLSAAAAVGLFDAVGDRPATARALATRCGLDVRATEMMLNALVGLDVLRRSKGGYSARPVVRRLLRADSKDGVAWMLRHHNGLARSWAWLDEVVRGGGPVGPERRQGGEPDGAEVFIRAMDDHSRSRAKVVAAYLAEEAPATMLDIGGGSGAYCVAFCRQWRGLKATLFDRAGVLEVATAIIGATPAGRRISMVAGDLSEDPLPAGLFDLVLLSNVIHSSGPAEVRGWLGKIRRVMAPGGLLVIHDFLTNATRTKPTRAAVFGINMLVNTPEGRVYSQVELRAWLKATGFGGIRSARLEGLVDGLLVARRPRRG